MLPPTASSDDNNITIYIIVVVVAIVIVGVLVMIMSCVLCILKRKRSEYIDTYYTAVSHFLVCEGNQ